MNSPRIPHSSTPLAAPLLAALLAILCLAGKAAAQLSVNLKSAKNELVAYEPVRVTVDITNRSSLPILLATATDTGDSWIRFMAVNERGDMLPTVGRLKDTPPIQLRPGQSIQQSIDLGTVFPLSDFGAYTLQAHVWCPPDRAFSPSNKTRVNIVGAREVWSAPFGVPVGQEDGGSSRIFRVLQFRTLDNIQLYVRLDDRSTGMVITCYSLGNMLELRDPMYTIDPEGRLHVLQISTPNAYYHTVIDARGKVVARDAYQEYKGSRPILTAAADGSIGVLGGKKYDPAVEELQRLSVRKISERPPGFDQLLKSSGAAAAVQGTPQPANDGNYQPLTPPPGR